MVTCGKKHSVAICLNSKEFYVWGSNHHLQLGLLKKNFVHRPKKMLLGFNKKKILGAFADNKSTFFLMLNCSSKDINIYVMSDSKKLLLDGESRVGRADQTTR